MVLTLNILRCPEDVPPESRQVSGGEFSIGRAPGNDWVLSDPDRHLSKRHCVLAFRNGAWQLADTSTNGTFLNRETEPVGAGAARTLREGDRLRLGAYEIEVAFVEAAQPPGWSTAAPHPDRPGSPFNDPFANWPAATGGGARPGPEAFERTDDPIELRSSVRLPDNFDPLADEGMPFGGPVQSDHTPAIEDAFRMPLTGPDLLPENWDQDEAMVSGMVSSALPLTEPPRKSCSSPPVAPPAVEPSAVVALAGRQGTGQADLMAAFLSGAGLKPSPAPSDPAASMQALGEAFRALVSGLRHALIARASIKGEFRIEQTLIRAHGNNPLKFSAGDDDALAALVGVGRQVDMTPAAAISEALRDMRMHELAVMAAMQYGVRALLARLDPAALRAAADNAGVGLPTQRRARAWTAFEKLHAEITRALADDFDSVFGKAFARAYELALAEAGAQRNRGE